MTPMDGQRDATHRKVAISVPTTSPTARPSVIVPDAIFDRDGNMVWGADRYYKFKVHVDDSAWGYFQEADGVSFRRRDKR